MPSTTPGGLVYPNGSDVVDVAADMQALAASAEAGNAWVTSGFSAATGWTLVSARYKRIGSIVAIFVDVTKATSALVVAAGSGDLSNVTIATAPSDIWPAQIQVLHSGNTGRVAAGLIGTSGNIDLSAVGGDGTNIATSDHINLGGVFFLGA